MFFRAKNSLRKKWFDLHCRDILSTPPLQPTSDHVVIVSEVSNRDAIMYLVAIKSFYSRVNRGSIVLLLDDDCPADQVELLKYHVKPAEIRHVQKIRSRYCPVGGTWERLLTIADLVSSNYVIQIDADTVTSGATPEIAQAIDANCSFMLSEWEGQSIRPIAEAIAAARQSDSTHVQMLAEQNFDKLGEPQSLKYARGQSSFAGFARDSFSVGRLEEFSMQMQEILGDSKWREWGSESLASNFMVANSSRATMLPYPKYASYYPTGNVDFAASAFVHFEGTNRLKNGLYVRQSKQAIARLREHHVDACANQ